MAENTARALRVDDGEIESVRLPSSGADLIFKTPRSSYCEHHFIAVVDGQPDEDDRQQIASLVTRWARRRAIETFNDPEAFMLQHHGDRVARRRGLHWHIFVIDSIKAKIDVLDTILAKNREDLGH